MSMFDDVLGMGRTSVCEGAYEPEVEAITMESVNDLSAYTDPIEFMTQVACEQELVMQRLDMAVMAEEYLYLRENGVEAVNEAGSIQGVIDKFKKGIDWLWTQITKFFKSVQKKIDDALKLDTRFVDKYKDKALAHKEKVEIKANVATLTTRTTKSNAMMIMDKIVKEVAATYGRLGKLGENATYESELKKALENIYGAKLTTSNDSTKAVMAALYQDNKGNGESEEYTYSFNPATYIQMFQDSKEVKESLKKVYDENKKTINQMYKAAKAAEKLAKKGGVLSTDESKSIHITVKVINRLGKDLTIVNKTYVKVINLQRSVLKKAIVKCASYEKTAGNEKVKAGDAAAKAATGESASLIDSVQFGEIL